MLITNDVLIQHNSCPDGIRWFNENYPNGAILQEILQNPDVPVNFLHWGWQHLPYTEQDYELYLAICNIINSSQVYESDNVQNSDIVLHSSKIYDSSYIYDSLDVQNCYCVKNSSHVIKSKYIFKARNIKNSQNILDSTTIDFTSNSVSSKYITQSTNIFKSRLINNSSEIEYSHNIANSRFISHCANSENLYFCEGLENSQNMIFNKPLSLTYLDMIRQEYILLINTELKLFIKNEVDNFDLPKMILNPKTHYEDLFTNKEIINWIRQLPNYDPAIMYKITYLPVFLDDCYKDTK